MSRVLMWVAAVVWAIWVGGQVYHEMMVIPIWRLDPPYSLARYAELGREVRGVPFFVAFSTLWPAVLSIGAVAAARGVAWRERGWVAAFAVIAWCVTVALIGWLAPTIQALFGGAYADPREAASAFAWWDRANTIRLWVEAAGLLVGLRALIGLYREECPSSLDAMPN